MSISRAVPTVLFTALALLLAGCGGSSPDGAVDDQIGAFIDGDGEAACAIYSDQYLESTYGAESEDPEAACVEDIEANALDDAGKEQLESAEIEVVEESDTTATVAVTFDEIEGSTLSMVKEGDDWLIDADVSE